MSTFIGFNGGIGFEKIFHRGMKQVVMKIKEICSEIVHDAREKGINATIIRGESLNNQPNSHLGKFGITASYDMGWSKRSSGRHFDSMTEHGFLIGGRAKTSSQWV